MMNVLSRTSKVKTTKTIEATAVRTITTRECASKSNKDAHHTKLNTGSHV